MEYIELQGFMVTMLAGIFVVLGEDARGGHRRVGQAKAQYPGSRDAELRRELFLLKSHSIIWISRGIFVDLARDLLKIKAHETWYYCLLPLVLISYGIY